MNELKQCPTCGNYVWIPLGQDDVITIKELDGLIKIFMDTPNEKFVEVAQVEFPRLSSDRLLKCWNTFNDAWNRYQEKEKK